MQGIHDLGAPQRQEAVAGALATNRLSNQDSSNKILYIVRVEDPTIKAKCRTYVALKYTEFPYGVEIVGYETNLQTQTKLTNYSGALEHAKNSKKVKIINKRIPWARILDVENKSYNK